MSLTPLHAGPLTLAFDPMTGAVRYLFAGEHEVLRGINAPVRDANWMTIAPKITAVDVRQHKEHFNVTFDAECESDTLMFRWRGTIRGDAEGTLIFDFDGEALRPSIRNRIGFCVLHPAAAAGCALIVEHTDGRRESSTLPKRIAPHQPFFEIRALTHEYACGRRIEVRLEGDTFEMEDQRNWTDASFKTYCTPLALPRPVMLPADARIRQKVTVRLSHAIPEPFAQPAPPWVAPPNVDLEFLGSPAGLLPALGTQWREGSANAVLAALRPLALAHLRIDLWLAGCDWHSKLHEGAALATALGTALELAVSVNDAAPAQLAELRRAIAALETPPRIARWLVFHSSHTSTPPECVLACREIFDGTRFAAPIGGGATDNFTELNRGREIASAADFTVHACNPQVHAFDDLSLLESLAIQGATVCAAREFSAGRPAIVSPITLAPRSAPNSAAIEEAMPAALRSFRVDDRLARSFAAAWTLGSVAACAESGAASLTYFEAVGANGLVGEDGIPRPAHRLFEVLAPFAGASVRPIRCSHPTSVAALALETADRRVLLAATFDASPRRVRIGGAWGTRTLTIGPEPRVFVF